MRLSEMIRAVLRGRLPHTRCAECGAVVENGHWGWCSQA